MIHKPIQLKNLSLCLPHKICFEEFNTQIQYGSKIAIIGRNGSGKSSLLNMLQDLLPVDVTTGYVPQIIMDFSDISGGQRFNKALTEALVANPNVLLLDEPTNHLDRNNKRSLMRLLRAFQGTLIVASHDVELLRNCIDTLWHIESGSIQQFLGNYDDYMNEINIKRRSIEHELSRLDRQKKDMHLALMHEQNRAAKSKEKGQKSIDNSKWPTIVSKAKAGRSEETSGRKTAAIDDKKQDINEKLNDMRLAEIILPKFSINADAVGNGVVVSIIDGDLSYFNQPTLLKGISLSVAAKERIAIVVDNGSGKSTLIKGILNDPELIRFGNWYAPQIIGYLDQHYTTLDSSLSVLEVIKSCVSLPVAEIRRHLNDFFFRKNEEVMALVSTLSGGEKARLSLAQIAVMTPKVLILDELTNNLDLETRAHVIQVLRGYPGAIIAISHDEDFLKKIGIETCYVIEGHELVSYEHFNLRRKK